MYSCLWQVVARQENVCHDEDTLILSVVISLADARRRKWWQYQEEKP